MSQINFLSSKLETDRLQKAASCDPRKDTSTYEIQISNVIEAGNARSILASMDNEVVGAEIIESIAVKGKKVSPPTEVPLEDTHTTDSATPKKACHIAESSESLVDRDVVVNQINDKEAPKVHLLLQDLINLEHILFVLQHGVKPSKEDEIVSFTKRVFDLVENGVSYRLHGHEAVPFPFMKSSGNFVVHKNGRKEVLSEAEAKRFIAQATLDAISKDELKRLENSPFVDVKAILVGLKETFEGACDTTLEPGDNDIILVRSSEIDGFRCHVGNKVFFSLVSELVSSSTKNSEDRIEAVFKIMEKLKKSSQRTPSSSGGSDDFCSVYPRFLIRSEEPEALGRWTLLSPSDVLEFCVIYIFEVYLEKTVGIRKIEAKTKIAKRSNSSAPVEEPTDNDVLFGRGGLTNTHPGNIRFRDLIALHRPDYMRASKMEKPVVARKIVQAFRQGKPTGRFLKKHVDGLWYDVGDRLAAEKTSQGLRERSNAEKRERSAFREAMRTLQRDSSKQSRSTPDLNKTASVASTPGSNHPLGAKKPKPAGGNKMDRKEENANSDLSSTANLPPKAVDAQGNILVTDYDILCGRGGLTNHHKGNKRFRDIVTLHRTDYVRAPKVQKPSVARVIVRAIRNGGGRFLKKNEKTGLWYDVGDKKAAEKTSQALREKSDEEREMLRSETTFDASQLLVNVSAIIP